jgi:uncharacterized protein YndB with AHSA1/START domain
MTTEIGPYAVRRSTWIDAAPERVWEEFATFERMADWYGTGHRLVRYEPHAGGMVITDAGGDHEADGASEPLVFEGRVLVFDPPRELTFEQDWLEHGWHAPALVTIRLTAVDEGTLVELIHHGFERVADDPGELLRGFEEGWTTRQLEALHERVSK